MSEFFVDVSIMNGWLEFDTPSGVLRAENHKPFVKVYCKEGDAFIFRTGLKCAFNPKSIYAAYEKWEDNSN